MHVPPCSQFLMYQFSIVSAMGEKLCYDISQRHLA